MTGPLPSSLVKNIEADFQRPLQAKNIETDNNPNLIPAFPQKLYDLKNKKSAIQIEQESKSKAQK